MDKEVLTRTWRHVNIKGEAQRAAVHDTVLHRRTCEQSKLQRKHSGKSCLKGGLRCTRSRSRRVRVAVTRCERASADPTGIDVKFPRMHDEGGYTQCFSDTEFVGGGRLCTCLLVRTDPHNRRRRDLKIGDETIQQTAECLNLLVSLRHWRFHWCQERVRLENRADNVVALTLVRAMNKVARELA